MTACEKAWLAGLLEGEGCFTIRKQYKPNGKSRAAIVLRMTDSDVIERAAALMEARAVHHKQPPSRIKNNSKHVHSVMLTGKRAASLMRELLPLMHERRSARINEILEVTK